MKSHEWQLTNLELSKFLKELGVKQESLWCWTNENDEPVLQENVSYNKFEKKDKTYFDCLSAFTVAELYKIIYDKGLDFGLPNRLKPEIIPTYIANFLIMELEYKIKEK